MPKTQKRSTLPSIASKEELAIVWERWRQLRYSPRAEGCFYEFTDKIISEILNAFGTGDYNAIAYDFFPILTVTWPQCYYIGLDLASGTLPRSQGSRYLLGATQDIEAIIKEKLGVLISAKLLDSDKVLVQASTLATHIINYANEACMLGIEDYPGMKVLAKLLK